MIGSPASTRIHLGRTVLLALLAASCVSGAVIALVPGRVCAAENKAPAQTLRKGDRGEYVCELQEYLSLAGCLKGVSDGVFGPATHSAVVKFQSDHGILADGIVGPMTWAALAKGTGPKESRSYVVAQGDTMYGIAKKFGVSVEAIASASGVAKPEMIRPGQKLVIPVSSSASSRAQSGRGNVELLAWADAAKVFVSRATITDVASGLSFNVQRRGGHNHADAEPLTAADTEVFRRIVGGAWSWERRAVIVTVGVRRIAASINCCPHGGQAIRGNGFDGHFCVHFLGSRTHASDLVDPDHQRMVRVAAGR
ncbi:MAG: peptidoglycan-binding protein [Clostridia bacterium]|nr:peptidoglycan-binding protein [Clostridia bacterium]